MVWPALAVLAAAVISAAIGFVRLIRAIRKGSISRLVRAQHNLFVLRLRNLIFGDTFRYLSMLRGNEREWFVRGLWKETGDAAARPSLPGGAVGLDNFFGGHAPDPHPVHLPDAGIAVHPFQLSDGSALVVVTLPPPREVGEAYLIGIWLPWDKALERDLTRARGLVRFFVVNKWELGRNTDFCEFTANGKTLTYNVGAPLNPPGFARTIMDRIRQAPQRRSSLASCL